MVKDGLAGETSDQINSHLAVAREIYNQAQQHQHQDSEAYKSRPSIEPVGPKTKHRATRNRSRMDIASAMLEAAYSGAIKSRIKRKVRISFTQLTEYLDYLLENEMLEYDRKTRLYRVTEKGLRFARMYKEIGETINPRTRVI
ncbi:winged helix-turn-helix domain-containing protein [Nitrososphaera viennensis]|nr:winged helix-turn-helix domain-containing protein [Nitrososphaera viennensis]UVS68180.1 winged helix-turn-helix domain-containing protein [Nitrososphaera viennensis]